MYGESVEAYFLANKNFQSLGNSDDEENNLHVNEGISEFSTNKVFISQDDLFEWVKATGRSLGYIIVTKRSKSRSNGVLYKVVYKCDRGGIYKSTKISSKNTGTKKINCPFILNGNHSLAYDCWKLKVICGTHNHEPALHMEGHPYPLRLSVEENRLVEDLAMNNVKPRDILSTIKKKNPDNVSGSQTIYNALYKIRVTNNAGKSNMQVLMEFLQQNDYIYYTRINSMTNQLEDLFFAHPKSLNLWQAFPHILLMDATYSTNRYNMPLLEIVGVTSTNKTFCVAFVYMHHEKEENYTWALNCLKSTWDRIISPRVIVTDREIALMNSCKVVFPDAKQMLCRWHISQAILRKCEPQLRTHHLWYSFIKAWGELVKSETEEIYLYKMAEIESLIVEYPRVLTYLNGTWLNPYKQWFVSCCTDRFQNCGNHTTNRVESQHALLKGYIPSAHSDIDKALEYIHNLIHIQESSIIATFEQSRTIIKHHLKPFKNLHHHVSIYAQQKIYKHFERSKFVGLCTENCGCQVRTCYGLPCAHEQATYAENGQHIPLNSVDMFWRKLEISPCIPIRDEGIPPIYNKQSKYGKRGLFSRVKEFLTPSKTPICEPAVHKSTRGRPPLKDKRFNKTTIDPPPQQPPRRSCSNASSSQGFSYKEPARHSSHVEKKSNYAGRLINQLPELFHPYIRQIQDVKPDGNCGFRAISACLGNDENEWATVRYNLLQELINYKEEYENMFGIVHLGGIYNAVNFFQTDRAAPMEYWLSTEMGIMIASMYNVILHMLIPSGSATYLPLRSSPPPVHQHTYIAIALVHGNHWVKVILKEGYPMPSIHPTWNFFKYDIASGWDTPYEMQLQMYMNHFRSNCSSKRYTVDD